MFDFIKDICLQFFSSVKDSACEYIANTWKSLTSIFTGTEGYGPITGRIAPIFSLTSKVLIDASKVILVLTTVVALAGLVAVVLPEILIVYALILVCDICASAFRKSFYNAQLVAA
jgi:hypothetical protein